MEKHIREGVSGAFGPFYFQKFGKKLILYISSFILYRWSSIQALPSGSYQNDIIVATEDDSEYEYLVDMD